VVANGNCWKVKGLWEVFLTSEGSVSGQIQIGNESDTPYHGSNTEAE